MSKYLKDLIAQDLSKRLDGVEDLLLVNVIGIDANSTVALRNSYCSCPCDYTGYDVNSTCAELLYPPKSKPITPCTYYTRKFLLADGLQSELAAHTLVGAAHYSLVKPATGSGLLPATRPSGPPLAPCPPSRALPGSQRRAIVVS